MRKGVRQPVAAAAWKGFEPVLTGSNVVKYENGERLFSVANAAKMKRGAARPFLPPPPPTSPPVAF